VSAGYSGKPLLVKLGIKDGHRVALLSAPDPLPDGLERMPAAATVTTKLAGKPFDVILLFATRRGDLEKRFAQAARALEPAGALWVSWPKKASGVATDITEDVVREVALPAGLVDNKVCAVDQTWSGLRCVWRLENRPKKK
jgi:hypothetical protein